MSNEISPARVFIKALCLFFLVNILYALVEPQAARASGYNSLFPGRTRLPFGVVGDPYTVTVEDVDAMFISHRVAAPKLPGEYRIVLIGDSSVWGEGLGAHEVISEQWNRMNPQCGEKVIRTYNLGYPHPSVVKDLVILDTSLAYEPDLILWFVTLNTVISQRVNPFLVANRGRTMEVLHTYEIAFPEGQLLADERSSFFERTLIGQRSNLARRIKLELLGIIWTATAADTNTLAEEDPPSFEIGNDPRYRGMEPPEDLTDRLSFRALAAGQELAAPVPVLIVNEPIFIAPRAELMVRYNVPYPRWAYDQYRAAMDSQAQHAGWLYLDLWNAIPPQYFLDAGLHLGAFGERLLIDQLSPAVQAIACQ